MEANRGRVQEMSASDLCSNQPLPTPRSDLPSSQDYTVLTDCDIWDIRAGKLRLAYNTVELARSAKARRELYARQS